jgi:hypothetical protein
MSAQIVFARFPARSHRGAGDWLRAVNDVLAVHGSDLAGAVTVPEESGPVVGWRLVSDNHREIGRGSRLVGSEHSALADARALLHRAGDLVVQCTSDPRPRTTGWFVTLDGELVMISARRYENRTVARNAGALSVRLMVDLARTQSAVTEFEDPAVKRTQGTRSLA